MDIQIGENTAIRTHGFYVRDLFDTQLGRQLKENFTADEIVFFTNQSNIFVQTLNTYLSLNLSKYVFNGSNFSRIQENLDIELGLICAIVGDKSHSTIAPPRCDNDQIGQMPIVITSEMLSSLQTLGLLLDPRESFTLDELKSAYKKNALRTHPDKCGTTQSFLEVTSAFEKLIDIIQSNYIQNDITSECAYNFDESGRLNELRQRMIAYTASVAKYIAAAKAYIAAAEAYIADKDAYIAKATAYIEDNEACIADAKACIDDIKKLCKIAIERALQAGFTEEDIEECRKDPVAFRLKYTVAKITDHRSVSILPFSIFKTMDDSCINENLSMYHFSQNRNASSRQRAHSV